MKSVFLWKSPCFEWKSGKGDYIGNLQIVKGYVRNPRTAKNAYYKKSGILGYGIKRLVVLTHGNDCFAYDYKKSRKSFLRKFFAVTKGNTFF